MAKSFVRVVAVIVVSPLIVTHAMLSLFAGKDSSLETHSQCLSLIPGTIGSFLRVAFYRFVLQSCDVTATISFGVLLSKTGARIGPRSYIGPRSMLGLVTIESDVLIGPSVQIPSGPHLHGIERLDVPIREQPGKPQRVTIGADSWVGGGAIVLADVASQNVVGAGSVVTKPTRPQTINVGNPAKEIKQRLETTS